MARSFEDETNFAKPIHYIPPKDPLQIMKDYLLLKLEEGDYHGVADAAMDIREMLGKKK